MIQRLKVTAIVLFLILDVIVATYAIKRVNRTPDSTESASISRTTETPTVTPSADTPTKTTKATGVVVNDGLIATYAAGACDGSSKAALELSSDGGKSFVEVALPLSAKADAYGKRKALVDKIFGSAISSAKNLTLIGSGSNCQPHVYVTDDGGSNWTKSDSRKVWYVSGDTVVSPTGVTDPQCTPTSVAAISDVNAKVSCTDGQIRGTNDAGDTWVGMGRLNGVSAVTFASVSDGYGVAKDANCPARAYSTGSAGGNWTAINCIDKNGEATQIGGSGARLVALVDGSIYVSMDQGRSWDKP